MQFVERIQCGKLLLDFGEKLDCFCPMCDCVTKLNLSKLRTISNDQEQMGQMHILLCFASVLLNKKKRRKKKRKKIFFSDQILQLDLVSQSFSSHILIVYFNDKCNFCPFLTQMPKVILSKLLTCSTLSPLMKKIK